MDRERWNERYQGVEAAADLHPPETLIALADHLPSYGTAADLAGGAGDAALWLADRGLVTTVVDVSDYALAIASERAALRGVELETVRADLTESPIPGADWAVLTCFHYLNRPLLGSLHQHLRVGGVALVAIATRTNLERNERPPERFLLRLGELPALVDQSMEVLHASEQWRDNGIHEAWLAARRVT